VLQDRIQQARAAALSRTRAARASTDGR
jgi:hypothetical protein